MTPGARLQAVIELLDEIETGRASADRIIEAYFRRRRYAGSKDRRAVAERVYGVLRRRTRLDWWTERAGLVPSVRIRALAAVLADDEDAEPLFDGAGHAPALLTEDEKRLGVPSLDHPDMPTAVRLEYPAWLQRALEGAFGADLEPAIAALNRQAPIDLRVNTLKTDRETACRTLLEDGVEAEPTSLSPVGLRLGAPRRLGGTRAFREGLIEIQDEGSQLVALLTGAEPNATVLDYCAGAGGKTLALAAAMENQGRLLVCDTDAKRLGRMNGRLHRAGVRCVETRALPIEGVCVAERVLLDVPCSGSGIWRRTPEARWRLDPSRLAEFESLQARLLDEAAPLVTPGGRLVYATCSFLRSENEDQVERFLAKNPVFSPCPLPGIWGETLGTPCPAAGPWLRLSPHLHGTDGFFAAVLERAKTP